MNEHPLTRALRPADHVPDDTDWHLSAGMVKRICDELDRLARNDARAQSESEEAPDV